ncbi:DnaJ family protein [Hondaea fermentalgiana]|uniref:DnaJ family protein n=1 Tax=Hondaea fermentalgiana TaxID=2315210 RepID=A0A2R5GI68_9STRA|nr:DnaJ family protein [Hondaea fermentalgiana]|eukprot:GBG30590.1 DnaJ family protein [Hondaea fermentalgiana]
MARTHYEVLGVATDASHEEVKRAYRELARATHPDVSNNPGSAKEFVRVSEAWEVLGASGSRRSYDRSLESAQGLGRFHRSATPGSASASYGAGASQSSSTPPPHWNANHGAAPEAGEVNRSANYMNRESRHYYRAKINYAKTPAERAKRMNARQAKISSSSNFGLRAAVPLVGIGAWTYFAFSTLN